jgi:mono/diheme cytochrome c family protein
MTRCQFALRVVGLALALVLLLLESGVGEAEDRKVLRPRVPPDQIEAARSVTNPLPATPEMIAKGKALYHGKAFCLTCHGRDGKGLGRDVNPKLAQGVLPRNFTERVWQKARTDGELMWVLKNGIPGTAMAAFVGPVVTEEEAWQLILYVRSFGQSP